MDFFGVDPNISSSRIANPPERYPPERKMYEYAIWDMP